MSDPSFLLATLSVFFVPPSFHPSTHSTYACLLVCSRIPFLIFPRTYLHRLLEHSCLKAMISKLYTHIFLLNPGLMCQTNFLKSLLLCPKDTPSSPNSKLNSHFLPLFSMFFSSYINLATNIYPIFQGRNLGVILFLICLFYVPTYLYFLSYCLCHYYVNYCNCLLPLTMI